MAHNGEQAARQRTTLKDPTKDKGEKDWAPMARDKALDKRIKNTNQITKSCGGSSFLQNEMNRRMKNARKRSEEIEEDEDGDAFKELRVAEKPPCSI